MTNQLEIADLFQPAPSGVTPGDPSATPESGSWLSQLLANGATLQLAVTSWQPGGALRTFHALMATMLAQSDVVVSVMAQGGFLDFAANGSVTYVAANGTTVTQKVSPDPSVPGENPTGALTWLDVLATSVYNVQRIGAQYASGTLAIANTTANTYGPYTPGTYHVANPTSGAGYANADSLTIAPANIVGGAITGASNTAPITITTSGAHGLTNSSIVYISGVLGNTAANGFWAVTVLTATTFILNGSVGSGAWTSGGTVNVCTTATFKADLAGTSGTSVAGTITRTTTVLSGVSVKNLVPFFGQEWESNTNLANRCRKKIQAISPTGPGGAYEYFALTASDLLLDETPPVQLSSAITRVRKETSTVTGIITVTVANASGPVSGVSNLGVTGATNASPIVVTTASAHGLASGDFATISGVIGNTSANGTWNITVLSPTTFSLNGSSGNAAYVGGGIVQGGDLGQVDKIIQANCVGGTATAITQTATAFNLAVVGSVVVPLAQVATYQAAVQTALANFVKALDIGGGDTGKVDYEAILGVLFGAGSVNGQPSYVVSLSGVTLNAGTVDVTFPLSTAVAVLSPAPAITVTGI